METTSEQLPKRHFFKWAIIVAWSPIVVILLFFGIAYVVSLPLQRHQALYQSAIGSVDRMRATPPKGVSLEDWNSDLDWTSNARGNFVSGVGQLEGGTQGVDRFAAFVEEFGRRSVVSPDCRTVEWMWDQLPEISRYGASSQRFRFNLRVCSPQSKNGATK